MKIYQRKKKERGKKSCGIEILSLKSNPMKLDMVLSGRSKQRQKSPFVLLGQNRSKGELKFKLER